MPWRKPFHYLLWAFTICWVVTLVGFGIIVWQVHDEGLQRCSDRAEAREAVRQLVELVVNPRDENSDGVYEYNPDPNNFLVIELKKALQPGGKLEEIHC